MQDAAQRPTAATTAADAAADAFIARWQGVTASELSTSQSFLIDLCRLLDVEVPHPTPEQDYMFERPITFRHGDGGRSAGRIDLYRRGAFVLESKKVRLGSHTKGFDDALLRARSQAEGYARALPADEGRPPFVVVVDVGQRIELYSEFSRSGATYVPFPDPRSHRIALADLRKPEIRERLRRVWTDPLALDPSRESARVTRQIADRLATLARSLEQGGFDAEAVAQFLMRCLFTMFAEDVKLLPAHSFRDLLARHAEQPDVAMRMLAQLWRDMDAGGFSAVLAGTVLRFNGKLFKQPDTLPLDAAQIALLLDAARADWKHVEPAIFGTLLERALSPKDRHKLGAHYTPRAYVERLVLPTVIEPLRREWSDAQAAAGTLADEGKADEAIAELKRFHHRLCTVRVLDPACGSGNFLYVTLEHLKRLEGEVLNALDELGDRQTGLALGSERADAMGGETVDPHNLLGIELNPRAAAIAEVVLWIGYLQWHYRTRGDVHPPQPVIRDFRNIENRDAVLAHDGVEFVTDERGVPVTRWDGETMKVSPVTGELVPDEAARMPVERYLNPRKAAWPEADFVVGNPPFIGASTMRRALGDGYVEALRAAWPEVPESSDFVMYWWHQAAAQLSDKQRGRFGLITTNSIRQSFNRRVIEPFLAESKNALSLVFAIPDHPWVDAGDGADVRIAMTVAAPGIALPGHLLVVNAEVPAGDGEIEVELSERRGLIHQDLRAGPAVASCGHLLANREVTSRGFMLFGSGFIVTSDAPVSLLDSPLVRPYRNGRDLTDKPRNVRVIDCFGLTEDDLLRKHPEVYQWLHSRVKPERDQNKDRAIRANWWLHGRTRPEIRRALSGLRRYIATVETAKHRVFQFLSETIAPDNKLIVIALDDGAWLGVLSSVLHARWATVAGGNLGVGNDPVYVKTRCFETFPFPDLHAADKFGGPITYALEDDNGHPGKYSRVGECPSDRIRNLAERLDAHRKRHQAAHPGLTLTGMYNVLDKLRSAEVLTAKERSIHEQGLVSVLRQLHDELDEAVLYAYGWGDLLPLLRVAHGNDSPDTLQRMADAERDLRPNERHVHGGPASTPEDAKRAFDEAILERLVALNAERAAEEARGHVRWLRPEFQNPDLAREPQPEQASLATERDPEQQPDAGEDAATVASSKPQPWPKDTVDQVRAVADLLAASPVPLSLDEIGARFTARGPWKKRLPKLVEMLVALGRAHEESGRFAAR
ncbi:class I SAM-dependent DNA methyltransferase [Luteimonas sp. MC1750]|uniref:class I SAM-dependent DNA methyltransferase n=1 Tax=Luteimonas sp. MC1750 TaxID=2799326 RepID=UPI0018F0869C|nr:class I SAM-dependent DNA methyltransferase [Luteimonas sp. MC1750]MBJ6983737.1 class I SAM-dependent DNA methyltransferase [Luteimonas sp. MC1750]QQO06572.1 class I SAM-dependent DNA methyltransferase [Luteimonas sp. MC1750]